LDKITQGLTFEVYSTVIANLLDVIPHIACTEVHTALERRVFVWALRLKQEFSEVFQTDPFGLITAAITYRARDITGIFVTLVVLNFAHRHVSLAVAVGTGGLDVDFEHSFSFLGLNKKTRPRLNA
jgi:hypothetical protein